MTPADLRALLAKGSPRPLRLECCGEHGRVTVPAHHCFGVRGADGAYAKSGHDMQLHVAAVNALPALLDVAEAANEADSCFEHAGNSCHKWCDRCKTGRASQFRLEAALAKLETP